MLPVQGIEVIYIAQLQDSILCSLGYYPKSADNEGMLGIRDAVPHERKGACDTSHKGNLFFYFHNLKSQSLYTVVWTVREP